ncbi:bis(5'-nucleosyl)-tetraphosphatase (symmetrical) ApaH [Candidatus Palibaumannia cicadellinicola]|uniref:Bis(5'-nucleosyl)-tetraphosphatase, symmetrical n=1 Tax=Baumannia cicadellinicola subsp. Homalodisca coagulata TaxID=374463 RepID=APAH_BAUCH|nr:bis(5'-nucleosyl)-tetraphosphatase (symmetrical) ApaH [Candidatus Baumannia cicadellinicola]Q1LSS3.1 RecName: Full=Bis(5'-nucleosyl)-tetraphosphatase, symmetrical; AltName: Full=Ap4A hydrolase; AltName: Full=Diadenosine 5',5'''-P1,P4-tetraphosphate pyrophosphohydrolase; AltName: Full=Diadenosine tetraphosphatase [Baumannia cicadellinicola str. Hc (Homalodisca coagulata)]ABF13981.1 bis(5'-nucleosyl)-tetraphosphatase (symmetrical) [Baumannia cicadellinicola str. Hc (Homalodisca coagulata)]MBS00
MSTYFIGDIHGCYDELQTILEKVAFDPLIDTLWLTGDLVARGPSSLEVLRMIRRLGNSVRIVLGNHDLHLLAVYTGIMRNRIKDHTIPLLTAPDAEDLMNWLRYQPVLQVDNKKKILMAHAGITPQWNIDTALQCASEIETVLRSESYPLFLHSIYEDIPNYWSNELSYRARLQFSTNVFTRMRYCFPNGKLDMLCKDIPNKAPEPLRPWFNLPSTIVEKYSIIFGHWSSLLGKGTPTGIYGLDTGCCWGGKLTLLCWEDKKIIQIPSQKKRNKKCSYLCYNGKGKKN